MRELLLLGATWWLPAGALAHSVAAEATPQNTTLFLVVMLMGLGAAFYLAAER